VRDNSTCPVAEHTAVTNVEAFCPTAKNEQNFRLLSLPEFDLTLSGKVLVLVVTAMIAALIARIANASTPEYGLHCMVLAYDIVQNPVVHSYGVTYVSLFDIRVLRHHLGALPASRELVCCRQLCVPG
jgi:hypothetical protein